MDDSLGDRIWVDRADCQAFVENVQTAFGTRLPSVSMLASETAVKTESACKSEYTHAHCTLRFHLATLFDYDNQVRSGLPSYSVVNCWGTKWFH